MKLDEVARRAGVSTATVSRVLNDLSIVRASTKARVLRAVEELNYHPDLNARNLAGGKSKTVGLICSNLENPFFFDIFQAVEREARKAGYDVVVAHTGYDSDHLVRSVRLMIGRRVGGLVVAVSEMDSHLIQDLERAKIRCVFYSVGAPGKKITSIRVNYRLGIERLVDYLHDLGHRRYAFVGHHTKLGPTSEREAAFVETVAHYSPQVEWRTVTDEDSLEGGRRAAHKLFSGGMRPTAIVCINDFMAVGVLRGLREHGLEVPRDVSVTGFDNIRLSEFCSPALTTVHIPRDRIGHLACEALLAEGGQARNEGTEIRIDPELVLRDSTRRPPDEKPFAVDPSSTAPIRRRR